MKSDLARVAILALPFMVFTASAQDVTVFAPTDCGSSEFEAGDPDLVFGFPVTPQVLLNNSY
jgi:hypothetical protein